MARYGIREAATLLKVTPDTLRRWEREKRIPAPPRLRRTGERQYDDKLLQVIRESHSGEIVTAEEWLKQSRRKTRSKW